MVLSQNVWSGSLQSPDRLAVAIHTSIESDYMSHIRSQSYTSDPKPVSSMSQPNPPPDPSLLPDSVLKYGINLDTKHFLSTDELTAIHLFRSAANYIAAGAHITSCVNKPNNVSAMIFLNDNVYLEQELTHDHIKPRLLGHWGTCPGLVLIYAHLNRVIRKSGLDALLVVGPGSLPIPCFIPIPNY